MSELEKRKKNDRWKKSRVGRSNHSEKILSPL